MLHRCAAAPCSVLSQVSEGTFLCGSHTINRAEFSAGAHHLYCTAVPLAPRPRPAWKGEICASSLVTLPVLKVASRPGCLPFPACCAGDNLEAGLGALVTKRLVEAHLRAKQRDAERLQRELEVRAGWISAAAARCLSCAGGQSQCLLPLLCVCVPAATAHSESVLA